MGIQIILIFITRTNLKLQQSMSDHQNSPIHQQQSSQYQSLSHQNTQNPSFFFPTAYTQSQQHISHNITSTIPSTFANNVLYHQQQEFEKVKPSLDTFQHQTALQIIIKLIGRNYSRFFIRGLTFAYINSLKMEQKNSQQQIRYITNNNQSSVLTRSYVKDINWPFKDLYLLQYRTPEQQQLFQFVNLCATMIQTNFKRYITQKRHKKALQKTKRSHQLLIAMSRGWKTHRVYNSRKIFEIRKQIRGIQQQIDVQEQNFINRDAKKLKMLYKYVQVHSKLFQETFNLYVDTGAWVFQENMRPKIKYNYTKPKFIPTLADSRPIAHNNQHQNYLTNSNSYSNDKQKQNLNSTNIQPTPHNIISSRIIGNIHTQQLNKPLQQRPICAKGAYILDDKQIEVSTKKPNTMKHQQKQIEQVGEETQKQRKRREQKQKQKKKMQKRQKYDPRKAIMQEKMRKKQKQQHQQQVFDKKAPQDKLIKKQKCITEENQYKPKKQAKRSLSPIQPTNKAQKNKLLKKKVKIGVNKSITNPSQTNPKKVKSKVDCWASQKQAEPQWVKQYKSRMIQQQSKTQVQNTVSQNPSIIVQNREIIQQPQNQHKKFEYSWQKKQIQQLKNHHEQMTRKNSTHNLRQQLKAIHQRNMASKNNFHRNVNQLEQAYNAAYSERYQRLIPKLQLLSYARGIQKQSKIPVIDEQCQRLYQEFSYIEKSSGHFWSLCSNHEKVFRGFLQRNIAL